MPDSQLLKVTYSGGMTCVGIFPAKTFSQRQLKFDQTKFKFDH